MALQTIIYHTQAPTYQGQFEPANSGHAESSTAALAAVLEH